MDAGIGEYVQVKELSWNDYRTVNLVKTDNLEPKHYVLKTFNKAKVMQNKSMVSTILNEK